LKEEMDDILSDLEKLEKLSLVSKVCTELENHLGINDKDLAEFIIHLAEKNDTFEKFKKALIETSGSDAFPDSFIANLLRLIQRMNPSMRPKDSTSSMGANGAMTASNMKEIDPQVKKILCPALALPNQQQVRPESDDERDDRKERTSDLAKRSEKTKESRDSRKDKKKKSKRKKHRSRSSSYSSRSLSRSRTRSRSRERERDRDRNRSSRYSSPKRNSSNNGASSSKRMRSVSPVPLEPVVGDIYDGIVTSIMQFGCFVQLKAFKKKTEGLVHLSNLREEGRVTNVNDVVQRHQRVKVKVIGINGTKLSLSMKEADQFNGKDLNPLNTRRLKGELDARQAAESTRNPDRPDNFVPVADDDMNVSNKKVKQISDFEKWELKQLMSANAIALTELPYYDDESGILQKDNEEDDADVEIELVEDECAFLKGYSRKNLTDLSPVKIVKNPDGSLQQAAMMQGALSKERRELKIAQQEAENAAKNNDDDEDDLMRPDLH